MADIEIRIADPRGVYFGMTDEWIIWLDDDAASWNWFADTTPMDEREIIAPSDQCETTRMDVIIRLQLELGH